ncbi:G-PROTEIN-RECEP-F1-2 domain-containing protein [Aphelenchoides fujianensis]|nr:G-PROTEIN-RECEP-F1-2 domain-containing protein [Aphelenchoides fujianensis]
MRAAVNFSGKCLTEQQMEMGSEFERTLQRYLFPCLCAFGILGNCLNLTVLLNKRMRSRSNTFLALLAISDIVFLTLLTPNILINFPIFTFNYTFRWLFFHSKVHLLALTNWSSAVALWTVIAVSAERLIGIRHPLYVRAHVASYKIRLVLFGLVMFPFVLTFYQHFGHICLVRHYCGVPATQVYSMCLPVTQERWFGNSSNPYSQSFRRFIRFSKLTNVTLVILVPILLLTALNMLLLCVLKHRSSQLRMNGDEMSTKPCVVDKNKDKHHRTEQRVTLTVVSIVTLFTVTNGPSAVDQLLQMAYPQPLSPLWYDISLVISTLVIIGKSSNFLVFCLFSKSFRNRLVSLVNKKVHEKLESRRKSSFMPKASLSLANRKETPNSTKTSTQERPSLF